MYTVGPPYPQIPNHGSKYFFRLVVGLIMDVNLRYRGPTVFIENNLHVSSFVEFKSVLFKRQLCSISVTTLVIIVAAIVGRIIF